MIKTYLIGGLFGIMAMADDVASAAKDGDYSQVAAPMTIIGGIGLVAWAITKIGQALLPIVKQWRLDKQEAMANSMAGQVAELTRKLDSMVELLKTKDDQIAAQNRLLELAEKLSGDTDKIRQGVHRLEDDKHAANLEQTVNDLAAKVSQNNEMLKQTQPAEGPAT